jgi:hypothetical protein
VEHLVPVTTVFLVSSDTDDLDLVADLYSATLDTAGGNGAAAGDCEDVLDRASGRAGRLALGSLDILSTASISSLMQAYSGASGSVELAVESLQSGTLDDGVSSPGNSYSLRSSRTSISTSSRSSGSSTWSTLFRKTTI